MKRLPAVLVFFTLSPVFAGSLQNKKFIEYGWDCPNAEYIRANVKEMEKIPFDGVVIRVNPHGVPGSGYGWETFSRVKLKPENYQSTIDDLKATKFNRFKHNFIHLIAYPGNVDWFEPEWSSVAHNAGCLAKVAKQTGCKGIMFDPEIYGETVRTWNYKKFPKNLQTAHTFSQYKAKVRDRGREFIKAINKEFPDITILCLYGPTLTYIQAKASSLEKADYALLAAFYEGICEASTPGTILVDGYESSYGYRDRKEFLEGRKIVLNDAMSLFQNKKAFRKHVRLGFGVWADCNYGSIGWHPDDFKQNYFTPEGLRASLNYALDVTDQYVWIYSERLRWWDGAPPPKEYVNALRLAKSGPGKGENGTARIAALQLVRADKQKGYSDEETFAEIRKSMTEIYDFPKDGWKFMLDKLNVGLASGWQKPNLDDSGWRTLAIGRFWEEQGENYDGRAWYRKVFTSPEIEPGKRVFLAVGAADEIAKIWLNGKFVGERDIGWDQPFALEVTRQLKPGRENLLAVQITDRVGAGGLWKSIKLMVK